MSPLSRDHEWKIPRKWSSRRSLKKVQNPPKPFIQFGIFFSFFFKIARIWATLQWSDRWTLLDQQRIFWHPAIAFIKSTESQQLDSPTSTCWTFSVMGTELRHWKLNTPCRNTVSETLGWGESEWEKQCKVIYSSISVPEQPLRHHQTGSDYGGAGERLFRINTSRGWRLPTHCHQHSTSRTRLQDWTCETRRSTAPSWQCKCKKSLILWRCWKSSKQDSFS